MRSGVPILLTHHGRLAGMFLPVEDTTSSSDLQNAVFSWGTKNIAAALKGEGTRKEDTIEDFEAWRERLIATRSKS
jgi:hypothetical protein